MCEKNIDGRLLVSKASSKMFANVDRCKSKLCFIIKSNYINTTLYGLQL